MAQGESAFFSYSREDSEFALRLAGDLKAAGANVWLDQLDIHPGDRWDRTVEEALTNCRRMVVILSPASVSSTNVMDEVSFALEERKTVIPVLFRDCTIPFRLRRVQYVDFRQDYGRGLQELLKTLARDQTVEQSGSAIPEVGWQSQSHVADAEKPQPAAELARVEEERRKPAEEIRPEEERRQMAEQARVEVEHGGTVAKPRLEDKRRKPAEQTRRTKPEREQAAQKPDTGTAVKKQWNARNSGTTILIRSIFGASDGRRLWAVGDKGTILGSDDGEHWNPRNSGTFDELRSIFGASDGKRLWAVGEGGTILESDDGGELWNPRETGTYSWLSSIFGPRKRGRWLSSIFGTMDGKRLWAVGFWGTVLVSRDGEHWNPCNSGTHNSLQSIFGTSDGKRLWAVGGGGTILESDDGGEHWDQRNSGTQNWLNSIFGTSDGSRLWAVGDGTILESDDGEHWNPCNSGIENSLHSIFGTSDGSRLWAVGEEGTILESDDGGKRWKRCKSGTRCFLSSIFGTSDGKRLWTVGDKGTILEAAVP